MTMFKFTGVVGGLIVIEEPPNASMRVLDGKRELLLTEDMARQLVSQIREGLFAFATWRRYYEQEKKEREL